MDATAGPEDSGARRSRLLQLKLRALVDDHLSSTARSTTPVDDQPGFPPGAALLIGDQAWVLLDERPGQRLGSAIAWAVRRGATELHVLAEREHGVLARRAGEFAWPITVWRVDGRALSPAPVEPIGAAAAPPAHHLSQRELIAAGGATPVVEHGVVAGEVRGLEVCRVVDGDDGHARLEIGVGVHDREAFQMLHGHEPTAESLQRVVDAVTAHRRPGAARHPFNAMAAERLLRWRLEQDPSLLGLRSVEASTPPVQRVSAVDDVPCVAHAVDEHGREVVVVCSTGVDLDLVPYAADARLAAQVGEERSETGVGRTLIVTPSRDRLGITNDVAAMLRQSVELVSIA